ncbi:MAG TPA: hypothetical protein VMD99_09610 [Terriglobales bacterium]|nr:hypothetical protein [Terriglobales bacterium]
MDRAAISDQIERILRSRSFASKSQLRKLLEVLSNNFDSQTTLKPDRVIKELWPEETKTKGSADVATEMNRLRHALESYYNEEGKTDSIAICLPNRSAPGPDGKPEKRWIVARPREEGTAGSQAASHTASEDQRPIARARVLAFLKLAAAVVAIAIVGYFAIRMLAADSRPQFGRMDASALTIFNAEGKELWRKVFPDGFGPDVYYAQGITTRIWFGDLEGNGHTSVLFLYSPAHPQPNSTILICYSDRGQEKWRWTPGRNLPELAGSPATYKTYALAVLKPTKTSPSRIVVSSAHDPWWPDQIALLDSSGKTVSEYWHSGALTSMVLADLDGDGRQEIIAAGVANGYDHQATLVVLDPDRVFGASTEVRPEFQIHGMGVAQERLRLLFPRSDLNQALFQYNQATDPVVEQGIVRLTVLECMSPPGCPIWYEFDKNFRLIAAYAGGDAFRSAHARFYASGKNAHPLSAEEQAAFQKVRCLVGCKSEFVPVGKLVP